MKESCTLVTQKEGKDVYRVTYLVRLPSYMRGEVIMHEDRPHLVLQIASSTTKLLNLKTHEPVNVNNAELYEARVVGRREDILDAIVLTDSKREVHVMNPRTYATVEIRKPPGYMVQGETVRVFVHEEDVYLVPQSRNSSFFSAVNSRNRFEAASTSSYRPLITTDVAVGPPILLRQGGDAHLELLRQELEDRLEGRLPELDPELPFDDRLGVISGRT